MKTSFQYSHQLNPPFFTLLRLKLSSRFKTTPIERRTNQSSLSTGNFHLNKKSTLISLPSRFSIKYCPQNNFPILFFSFLAMAQLSKEKKKKEKKRRPPVGARCYQSFHLRRLALYRDRDPINQAGPKQTATKLDVTFARSRPTVFFLSLYFFFFYWKKNQLAFSGRLSCMMNSLGFSSIIFIQTETSRTRIQMNQTKTDVSYELTAQPVCNRIVSHCAFLSVDDVESNFQKWSRRWRNTMASAQVGELFVGELRAMKSWTKNAHDLQRVLRP